ncbi:class I SAM-dependent methyltransferase [Actibacterium ureilyticum]|uniref:class I SAM-dependent methyltransferase n=1 Tax=Actibacterium ureilyticum TaxID=1590614 RepID=UPI000BAAA2B1|nr:class I SAM-dependent methyltransferase [Actibacterium ureilyticum]
MFKRQKKTKAPQSAPIAPADAGFNEALGPRYLSFLGCLHTEMQPKWYLEVGSQTGSSLTSATGNVIAVDPAFVINKDIMGQKTQLHLFQMTSDDFFAAGALEQMGVKLDLSFLDGMHLFEFLLRDFMNSEKHASADGIIVMHDCVPRTKIMAERDWDKTVTRQWTGDVWKLLPILRRYRPDLKVTVLDCAPTGLVVVSGLSPDNTVLPDSYDQIIAEYTDLNLDTYGVARFFDELDMRNSEEIMTAIDGKGADAIRQYL